MPLFEQRQRLLVLPNLPIPVCSYPSPEGTVSRLQDHREGAPAALVLFSTGPLPGLLFLTRVPLHPAVHSLAPILHPGLRSVPKACLQRASARTWNKSTTDLLIYGRGGDAVPKAKDRKQRSPVEDVLTRQCEPSFPGGTQEPTGAPQSGPGYSKASRYKQTSPDSKKFTLKTTPENPEGFHCFSATQGAANSLKTQEGNPLNKDGCKHTERVYASDYIFINWCRSPTQGVDLS